jgi:hypothetical protein
MKIKLILGMAAGLLAANVFAAATEPPVTETPQQHDARMAWWRTAKFGMFIHWGIYSVPAGEWNGKTDYAEWFLEETHMPVSQYAQFAQQFDPEKFDAKAWVEASRRLRHVAVGFDRLVHQIHAVQARPVARTIRRVPPAGHYFLRLLFHHGLAQLRLGHAPRLERRGHRHAGHGPLRRLHERTA